MRWLRRAFARGEPRLGGVDGMLRRTLLRVLEHDLEAAEELLSRVVRIDSDEVDAYLALARVYRTRGEIGRAIRIHQNLLLRRDLDDAHRLEALAGLAGDFQQGGFLRRAIAAFEELLARRPGHTGALRALVRLHADVRDFPRALEVQRRLARQEGSDRRAGEAALRVEMAATRRAEGMADAARRSLRRAVRLDPRNVEGWILLGELEAERGRPQKALEAWRKVPGIDRRSGPRVFPRMEATQAGLGRREDHERYLHELVEAHPRDAGARLALARSLVARGEAGAAAAEVRRVLEQEPESIGAHAALGRALLAEPREPEVAKAFAELLDVLERGDALRARERLH